MDNKIARKYTIEDEKMLVNAQVKHQKFVDNLAVFTAEFPFMNVSYAANFQALISAAEAIALDQQHTDLKRVLTEDLKIVLEDAYRKLRKLDAYATFAYPSANDKRQRAFGQSEWAIARRKKDKMVDALDLAHQKLTEEPFKTDLSAQGFSLAMIADLATIANQLRTEGAEQKSANQNRPISTQERISALNAVWRICRQLRLASKVVFDADPAMQKAFNLYPKAKPKPKVEKKEEENEEKKEEEA